MLPEVTVASCTCQGSCTQITDVYTAVIAWMEANGYEPAEAMFNIYNKNDHSGCTNLVLSQWGRPPLIEAGVFPTEMNIAES